MPALTNDDILRLASRVGSASRAQGQTPVEQQDEQSLLSSIGSTALSSLGAAGNLLDIPGSMARDLLTLNNPFDQLLSPFSAEDRVTGREVLTQYGLTDPNKETGMAGWLADPMEGVRDVSGFLTETALDPLNMLSRPLKAAGLGADAAKATRVTKSGRGLIDNITDPFRLAELGDKLGVRRGLGGAGSSLLTRVGARLPKGFTSGVSSVAGSASRKARELIDYRVQGAATDEIQRSAMEATKSLNEMIARDQEAIVPVMTRMADELSQSSGEFAENLSNLDQSIRRALEDKSGKTLESLPPSLQGPVSRIRGYQAKQLEAAKRAHININELEDELVNFAHRQRSSAIDKYLKENTISPSASGRGVGPGAVSNLEHQGVRHQLFKDSYTDAINNTTSDAAAHGMLEGINNLKGKDYDTVIARVAGRLREVAGPDMLKDMKATNKEGLFQMLDDFGEEAVFSGQDLKGMSKNLDWAPRVDDYAEWTPDPNMPEITEQVFIRSADEGIAEIVTSTGDVSRARVADLTSAFPRRSYTRVTEVGGEEITETFSHVYEDRFLALAEHMKDMPQYEEAGGIFGNLFVRDALSGMRAADQAIANAQSTTDLLANGFKQGILNPSSGTRGKTTTLRDVLNHQSFGRYDKNAVVEEIVAANKDLFAGVKEKDLYKTVMSSEMSPEIAQDLIRVWDFQSSAGLPGAKDTVRNAFRSVTSLFKAGVLTAPARYARDLVSGQVANMYNGMFSLRSAKSAWHALHRQADESLLKIPAVQEYLKKADLPATAENATEAVRELYAAHKGHAAHLRSDLDFEQQIGSKAEDFESMMGMLPGIGTKSLAGGVREVGATAVGRRGGSFNWFDIAGVNKRTSTQLNPVRAGDMVGKQSDDLNRMVGFVELLRKGDDPATAMGKVNRVQLNYDPRTFTPTEQAFKKVFPFYSFMSRQMAYVGTELMSNPAGRLGQLIRGIRLGEDEDEYLPEHVKGQFAMNIGPSGDGGTNYLTGLGLMFEDSLNTLPFTGSQDFLRGLIGKTNPIIKGPVEWAMGRSSFQGGPLGGRDLHDMDPVIGRILTQMGAQTPLPGKQAAPVAGSRATEFIAANSPVSRLLSSVKTSLDDRKTPIQRALNLLTGMRISSVSPEQQRRGLRDVANAIARDLGSRPFQTFHVSQELIDSAQDEDKARLIAIKALRDHWDRLDKAAKAKAN